MGKFFFSGTTIQRIIGLNLPARLATSPVNSPLDLSDKTDSRSSASAVSREGHSFTVKVDFIICYSN